MANDGGRWEALVDTSIGGTWAMSVTDDGGTFSLTPSVATYITTAAPDESSGLLATIESALQSNSSSGNAASYSVSLDSNGVVTIANPDDSFSVDWSGGTTLRDLLGYTGNLSTANTHAASNVCQAVWIPHTPYLMDYDVADEGYELTDAVVTVAPSGAIKALYYNRRTQKEISYEMLFARYTRKQSESTTNESLQSFIRGTQWGDYTWAQVGTALRFYETKTGTSTSVDYLLRNLAELRPEPRIKGLTTVYDVHLELAKNIDGA